MTKTSADRINLISLTVLVTLTATFIAEAIAVKLYEQHQQISALKLEKYDLVNNLRQVGGRLKSCSSIEVR